jgi:hypothetical protein
MRLEDKTAIITGLPAESVSRSRWSCRGGVKVAIRDLSQSAADAALRPEVSPYCRHSGEYCWAQVGAETDRIIVRSLDFASSQDGTTRATVD